MKAHIQKILNQQKEFIRNTYRHLHAHPELSFEEHETAAFVCRQLENMQIPYRSGIAGTGILARIEGRNPEKRCIALRADMDALPVCENVNIDWKSKNENVMHACGHDAHTACLLGAAAVLNEIRNDFEGTILLVFQPGEEKAPGGARLMLEAGIFDDYKPELIIAQHVSVDFPTGTMAFLPGKIMASADEIHVKVKGKGGHGALPHLVNATVLATAQPLVSLQQVNAHGAYFRKTYCRRRSEYYSARSSAFGHFPYFRRKMATRSARTYPAYYYRNHSCLWLHSRYRHSGWISMCGKRFGNHTKSPCFCRRMGWKGKYPDPRTTNDFRGFCVFLAKISCHFLSLWRERRNKCRFGRFAQCNFSNRRRSPANRSRRNGLAGVQFFEDLKNLKV